MGLRLRWSMERWLATGLIALVVLVLYSPIPLLAQYGERRESVPSIPSFGITAFHGIRVVSLGSDFLAPQLVQEVSYGGGVESVVVRGREPDSLSEVFLRAGECTWHVVPDLRQAIEVKGDYAVDPSILTVTFLQSATLPDSGALWKRAGLGRFLGHDVEIWDVTWPTVGDGHFRIWIEEASGVPVRVEKRHRRGSIQWSIVLVTFDLDPTQVRIEDLVPPDTEVHPSLPAFKRGVLLARIERLTGASIPLDRLPDQYDVVGASNRQICGLTVLHAVLRPVEGGNDVSVFVHRPRLGLPTAKRADSVQETLSQIRRRFGRDIHIVTRRSDSIELIAVGEADPGVLDRLLDALEPCPEESELCTEHD